MPRHIRKYGGLPADFRLVELLQGLQEIPPAIRLLS